MPVTSRPLSIVRQPAPTAAPAALTTTDQARIDQALRHSRAANTRVQYRSAGKAWMAWAAAHDHQALPAAPAAVASYLASLGADGKAL